MDLEQQYFFWKLAYDLVSRHNFHIIHLHSQHNEVWLEKSSGNHTDIVRLLKKDFAWSNHVKTDLAHIDRQLEKNRRYFSGRRKRVHVLYVSEQAPVDEFSLGNMNFKHHMQVEFLSDKEKEAGLERLSDKLGLAPPLQLNYKIPYAPMEYESTVEYMKQQLYTYREKERQEVKSVFGFGKVRITYLLLLVNILIFYYLESVGSTTSVATLIEYGAKYNPAIIEGEWWRLISSMFLHIGVLHIAMNMLALFYLGTAVEQIYGSTRFTILYFLAGILGSAASFYFNDSVAAGASGAIFGLFGALLYFAWRYPSLFFRTMGWNLIILVAFNIVFGMTVPQVDNSGHMGGLAGGFLASQLVDLPRMRHRSFQLASFLLYGGILVFFMVGGMNKGSQVSAADIQYLNSLNKDGEYEQVIQIAERMGETEGEWEEEWLFQRSYAYLRSSREEEAFQDLQKVVELDPDFAEAHYNLSLLYAERGNEQKANFHREEAERLDPELDDPS